MSFKTPECMDTLTSSKTFLVTKNCQEIVVDNYQQIVTNESKYRNNVANKLSISVTKAIEVSLKHNAFAKSMAA